MGGGHVAFTISTRAGGLHPTTTLILKERGRSGKKLLGRLKWLNLGDHDNGKSWRRREQRVAGRHKEGGSRQHDAQRATKMTIFPGKRSSVTTTKDEVEEHGQATNRQSQTCLTRLYWCKRPNAMASHLRLSYPID